MAFTSEIIDFTGLESDAIQTKLAELNIPLTPEEAVKIQNEMLGRAPSLAELVSFAGRAALAAHLIRIGVTYLGFAFVCTSITMFTCQQALQTTM